MAGVQRSGQSRKQELGGSVRHLGGESQWGRGLEPASEVWGKEEGKPVGQSRIRRGSLGCSEESFQVMGLPWPNKVDT